MNIRKCALVFMFYELCAIIWGWKHVEKVNMVLDKILENILKRIVLCRAEVRANALLSSSIHSCFFLSPVISEVSPGSDNSKITHPRHVPS